MPVSPPKPCTFSGCGRLVHGGGSRCSAHARVATGKFNDRERGSRHERGYGSAWVKLRESVMLRDRGLCQPCLQAGRLTPGSAVDHKINKAEWLRRNCALAGVDHPSNLQTICVDCHKQKTQKEAAESRARDRLRG